MNNGMDAERNLNRLFEKNNIKVPAWLFGSFDGGSIFDYYNFLLENNERGGFFSRKDSEKIFTRHLFESVVFCYYVSKALSVSRETKVADAGTGPGLPGYLFAAMREPPILSLVDSSRRRLSILEEFHVKQKGHNNVFFLYGRLEELENVFDIVTARALIPFPFVLELLARNVKKGGFAALYSADEDPLSSREVDYIGRLGFIFREVLVPLEANIESRRTIKILQKINPTASGYPREWKKIKEEISQWQK